MLTDPKDVQFNAKGCGSHPSEARSKWQGNQLPCISIHSALNATELSVHSALNATESPVHSALNATESSTLE